MTAETGKKWFVGTVFMITIPLFSILHSIQNDRLNVVEALAAQNSKVGNSRICRIEKELLNQGKAIARIEVMLAYLTEDLRNDTRRRDKGDIQKDQRGTNRANKDGG